MSDVYVYVETDPDKGDDLVDVLHEDQLQNALAAVRECNARPTGGAFVLRIVDDRTAKDVRDLEALRRLAHPAAEPAMPAEVAAEVYRLASQILLRTARWAVASGRAERVEEGLRLRALQSQEAAEMTAFAEARRSLSRGVLDTELRRVRALLGEHDGSPA